MTYDLSKTYLLRESNQTANDGSNLKVINGYSVFFNPGYAFNESALGYFKIAYHAGTGKGTSINKSLSGYGYGFGTKLLLDKNLFLNLEIEQVNYNKVSVSGTDLTGTQILGLIGIGYKF